ncbi:MAG: ABC transporter ATP-binding protein [Candidatus Rifleibacteriota bacterium]
MNTTIKVESLSKKFGKTKVVNGISFEVLEGEIFGFLGPNGAGKTTTVRMMIGEIVKDAGNIEILGHIVPEQMQELKRLVGVVPDHQNLYDRISVRQNLEFFADLYDIDYTRIDEVLEKVFLVEHQNKAAIDLSRGLRQRTLIARSLLHQPKVLFLDEPTSALDPNSAILIRELIKELKLLGTTIFLTTHYMEEADSLCDRLAIMHHGNIVACSQSKELKKSFSSDSLTIEYEDDSGKIVSKIYSLNDFNDRQTASEIIATRKIISIHSHEASLEQVFLKVTGSEWKDESKSDEA